MDPRESSRPRLVEAALTGSVIGAFYEVYNWLDYGLLESVYSEALNRELVARGHEVEREVLIQLFYKGVPVAKQRVDMIVDERLIVEIKSTHDLSRASHRQLYAYLRGSELRVGLLLHFGPKAEFYRIVCTRSPRTQPKSRILRRRLEPAPGRIDPPVSDGVR